METSWKMWRHRECTLAVDRGHRGSTWGWRVDDTWWHTTPSSSCKVRGNRWREAVFPHKHTRHCTSHPGGPRKSY